MLRPYGVTSPQRFYVIANSRLLKVLATNNKQQNVLFHVAQFDHVHECCWLYRATGEEVQIQGPIPMQTLSHEYRKLHEMVSLVLFTEPGGGALPGTMNEQLTHAPGQGWGTRTRYSQYSSTEFLVLVLYSYSRVPK